MLLPNKGTSTTFSTQGLIVSGRDSIGKKRELIHFGTFGTFLISLPIKCELGTKPIGYITIIFHWTFIAVANWGLH